MSENTKLVTLLKSDLPKTIMAGPCSSETTFTLHVQGPFSSREASNIIALLELQKGWLLEDEAAVKRELDAKP